MKIVYIIVFCATLAFVESDIEETNVVPPSQRFNLFENPLHSILEKFLEDNNIDKKYILPLKEIFSEIENVSTLILSNTLFSTNSETLHDILNLVSDILNNIKLSIEQQSDSNREQLKERTFFDDMQNGWHHLTDKVKETFHISNVNSNKNDNYVSSVVKNIINKIKGIEEKIYFFFKSYFVEHTEATNFLQLITKPMALIGHILKNFDVSIKNRILHEEYKEYNETSNTVPEMESSENGTIQNRLYFGLLPSIGTLIEYIKNEIRENLPLKLDLDLPWLINKVGKYTNLPCDVCIQSAEIFLEARDLTFGLFDSPTQTVLSKICLVMYSKDVCDRIIQINMDVVIYILNQKRDNSKSMAKQICSVVLQGVGSKCGDNQPLLEGLEVKLTTRPNDIKEYNNVSLNTNSSITIAQITDIHYDSEYKVGSPTSCKNIICCREKKSFIQNVNSEILGMDLAGKMGSIAKCDVPLVLVQNAMEDVAKKNPTYVYFTGDIIAHNIWTTSIDHNTRQIKFMLNEFKNHFSGTPVFPILGNHEAHPLDMYSPKNVPEKYSLAWLYDLVADEWPKLMFPNKNVSDDVIANITKTIKAGGYYTVKTDEGLRIIALNNNGCYKYNWWLWLSPKDIILEQLQWLADTLQAAEDNKELVHILFHVPPQLDNCFEGWNREYHKIVTRYSHLIRGQFCGHTHFEELKLFLGKNNEAIGAIFNGGCVTTYRFLRPNYRIYELNQTKAHVKEFSSYVMPLDENSEDWVELYKFAKTFGVPDLSVENLEMIYRKIAGSDQLKREYVSMKYKGTSNWTKRKCDETCLMDEISQIPLAYPEEKAETFTG